MARSKRPNETPNTGELVVPAHGRGKIKRGNPKGTPAGPGRPRSEWRALLREAVSNDEVANHVRLILKDPSHDDWFRVLEWADKRGYPDRSAKGAQGEQLRAKLLAQLHFLGNTPLIPDENREPLIRELDHIWRGPVPAALPSGG